MAKEELYRLAYAFRKTKLWNRLFDTELFAVQLDNGEVGICSVMGSLVGVPSVAVYIGTKGLRSLFHIFQLDDVPSPARQHEALFSQCCLKCDFMSKSEIESDRINEVQTMTKKLGIRLCGANSYVSFYSYEPNRLPVKLPENQEDVFCQALSAALAVAEQIPTMPDKLRFGFQCFDSETKQIPMLRADENGAWQWDVYDIPELPQEVLPEPIFENELLLHKAKQFLSDAEWMCDVIPGKSPVDMEDGSVPYIPTLLLLVNANGMAIPTEGVKDYQTEHAALLNQLLESMIEMECVPSKIYVANQKTYSLLRDLCQKLGISLELKEFLPELTAVENELYSTDEMSLMMNAIVNSIDELGDEIPDNISTEDELQLNQLKKLKELLSDLIEESQPPKKAKKKKAPKMRWMKDYSGDSYVISVSPYSGCYRHIRLSGNTYLSELATAILDTFEFDDDHLYAFFMDNKAWSHEDTYYRNPDDYSERSCDDARLGDLHLEVGKKFLFLFDFGDEWRFQCKVLKVLQEETKDCQVIRSKGEAPKQYPDWE